MNWGENGGKKDLSMTAGRTPRRALSLSRAATPSVCEVFREVTVARTQKLRVESF